MPLQPRHTYAAGFQCGLPTGDITQSKSSPTQQQQRRCRAGARCNPAHIRQIRAGGLLLRGVQPLVHFRYAFPSRLPDPDHLAVLARPGFVRAAVHPHPRPRRSGCPQLQPVRCDELMAVSFHHCKVQERLVALDVGDPQAVRRSLSKSRLTRSADVGVSWISRRRLFPGKPFRPGRRPGPGNLQRPSWRRSRTVLLGAPPLSATRSLAVSVMRVANDALVYALGNSRVGALRIR